MRVKNRGRQGERRKLCLMTYPFRSTITRAEFWVDIPESHAAWSANTHADDILKDVTLRILKREWQKVWFRNKNL